MDGPQKMKLNGPKKCVGGQRGLKVDGPKRHKVDGTQKMKLNGPKKCVGGQRGLKVDGPEKCVGNKNMKVHGLRLRGWSKRGESGRY